MPVSERILTARLHSRHLNIFVVLSDSDKNLFYLNLSSTFNGLPKHGLQLLLGDLNTKVTSDSSR